MEQLRQAGPVNVSTSGAANPQLPAKQKHCAKEMTTPYLFECDMMTVRTSAYNCAKYVWVYGIYKRNADGTCSYKGVVGFPVPTKEKDDLKLTLSQLAELFGFEQTGVPQLELKLERECSAGSRVHNDSIEFSDLLLYFPIFLNSFPPLDVCNWDDS